MCVIRLIHWNADEAEQRAAKLRAAGYRVDHAKFDGPPAMRKLRDHPPAAVAIDLSRAPSQGRDVALAIRHSKATRHLPLVFVDGDPEKVARIKEHLPDAVYTSWSRIRSALKRAVAHPPTEPVVPRSVLAGYSGTPLAKKLGIKAASVVALVGAPQGFRKTLGDLPEGATVRTRAGRRADVTLWFARSGKDLHGRIQRMAASANNAALWILWPKKTSALACDLTQAAVRKAGLASGLVDYKVCAVDATWSGLLFTKRRSS